jgi:hypothetical protein
VSTFHFMVLSNPVEGREEDFNTWYDDEHVVDLLAVEGITAVQRYRFAALGPGQEAPAYRYVAIYEAEADDVAAVQETLMTALRSGAVRPSDAIAPGALATWFEPIGERRVAAA